MSFKKNRLFFAIELATETKIQLLKIQQSMPNIIGTQVAGENFHITLSFLGHVNENQLELILDSITPLQIAPFKVKLKELIYWPKPKILALSIEDFNSQLLKCKKQIESQLADHGFFQFEKRHYIPHITLFHQVEVAPKKNQLFSQEINVNQFSLMQSKQGKKNIFYQTIESFSLQSPSVKQQLTGR